MKYQFEARSYKRIFRKPLVASWGVLREREGLIVRLENDLGEVGFGEIAPMGFLGSENYEEAKCFCSSVGAAVSDELIAAIDEGLPCCGFGMRSALRMLRKEEVVGQGRVFEVAALLSLVDGESIDVLKDYKTFKCKIGMEPFIKERELFLKIYDKLPQGAELRLDANGALSLDEAKEWLNFLEKCNNVQFLEQPLSKGQEGLMLELSRDYGTPIALDESVIGGGDFANVCESGWPGWVVIKPCLVGDIEGFCRLRKQCDIPIVYSSVFETAIGMEAALRVAAGDVKNNYALGFGTINYFFPDGFGLDYKGSRVNLDGANRGNFERIWGLCKKIAI